MLFSGIKHTIAPPNNFLSVQEIDGWKLSSTSILENPEFFSAISFPPRNQLEHKHAVQTKWHSPSIRVIAGTSDTGPWETFPPAPIFSIDFYFLTIVISIILISNIDARYNTSTYDKLLLT